MLWAHLGIALPQKVVFDAMPDEQDVFGLAVFFQKSAKVAQRLGMISDTVPELIKNLLYVGDQHLISSAYTRASVGSVFLHVVAALDVFAQVLVGNDDEIGAGIAVVFKSSGADLGDFFYGFAGVDEPNLRFLSQGGQGKTVLSAADGFQGDPQLWVLEVYNRGIAAVKIGDFVITALSLCFHPKAGRSVLIETKIGGIFQVYKGQVEAAPAPAARFSTRIFILRARALLAIAPL